MVEDAAPEEIPDSGTWNASELWGVVMPDDGIPTLAQAGHRMIYHGEKFQIYFLVRRQHIRDST